MATKEANNDQHIKITDLDEQIRISNSSASAAGGKVQDGGDRSINMQYNMVAKASFTTEVERQLIQHSLQSREKQSPRATFYGSSVSEPDGSSKLGDQADGAPTNGQDQEW